MNLTKLEIAVLSGLVNDDVISDYGWNHPNASAWIGGYWEDEAQEKAGKSDKKFLRGVLSSLNKKGIIASNDGIVSLTDKGRQIISNNPTTFDAPVYK